MKNLVYSVPPRLEPPDLPEDLIPELLEPPEDLDIPEDLLDEGLLKELLFLVLEEGRFLTVGFVLLLLGLTLGLVCELFGLTRGLV